MRPQKCEHVTGEDFRVDSLSLRPASASAEWVTDCTRRLTHKRCKWWDVFLFVLPCSHVVRLTGRCAMFPVFPINARRSRLSWAQSLSEQGSP